ncbi:hypothetical protein BZA05DRAFT_319441, partial [Tricharina praecox]|uniref:uncharacterized protein n=1 Tax=Tricharina praecox TaxID=43433 RepID=UPI00221F2AF4
SLSGIVSQIYNVVQDLSNHLDATAPPQQHSPSKPATSKMSMPEFPTLDDIGACLEAVYTTLHTRVEVLSRHPPSHGTPGAAAVDATRPPLAQTPGLTNGGGSSSTVTLKLTHETLKKDATQLSAALLRSQKRAETLEKKMLAFENENEQNALDRERLVANIEMLEETVEELRRERDEARVELHASGGQWCRIVGNAARIEKGLWLELKKRRGSEGDRGEGEGEGEGEGVGDGDKPQARCEHCAGSVDRLLDANRTLKRRVDALECSVERMRCGGKEMAELLQRLGALG